MTKPGSDNVKDELIKLRLPGREKRRIAAAAHRARLSISEWLRQLAAEKLDGNTGTDEQD
jgi:hypothetical protein